MAFETSVLQNGEWTTRTLDVNTVLRHYNQQDQEATANAVEIERGPVLGLLTQTIIRSPVVHWILPAKLRSPAKNDVAFIGVREVSYFNQRNPHFAPLERIDSKLRISSITQAAILTDERCLVINVTGADFGRMTLFRSRSCDLMDTFGMLFEKRNLALEFGMLVLLV